MSISLNNVSYWYPGADVPAVRNATLEIPAGQCVLITGPSGCGKTTLTRLINGFAQHVYDGDVTGSVYVNGQSITDWSIDELGCQVGSVFQNPRSQFVNPDTTSEIAFGCESLGLDRKEMIVRVEEATEALSIRRLLGRPIKELSGGQKQSVIIASAYAMHPDIFVLDEPTASLDPGAIRQLASAIRQLKAQGKTMVISEHRLWWLNGIADRIITMADGCIVADQSAQEFAACSPAQRAQRGLRVWDVAESEKAYEERFGCEKTEVVEPAKTNIAKSPKAASIEKAATADSAALGSAESQQDSVESVPAVEVRDVTYGYGSRFLLKAAPRKTVLDGLSLNLKRGIVTGIVGENGAGKTTLMRMLAGLQKEQSGTVRMNGQVLASKQRAGVIHLVMQEPGYQLFASSVQEELEQALKHNPAAVSSSEAAAAVVEKALEDFDLLNIADRHPLSLSGGQRQRLAIAAGILQGSDVIVLDEPTSGLDLENMQRVATQLRGVAAGNKAVCVVSHDLEFLTAACDEVAELKDGSIVGIKRSCA